ncbi:MAG: hypothetical protein WAU33_02590 [Candidatus Binataceae bacterium]
MRRREQRPSPASAEAVFAVTQTLQSFLLLFAIAAFSAVLWYGTYKRWRGLCDPPVKAWYFYSHSAIKKFFGSRAVIAFNYFLVLSGIAICVIIVVSLMYPSR